MLEIGNAHFLPWIERKSAVLPHVSFFCFWATHFYIQYKLKSSTMYNISFKSCSLRPCCTEIIFYFYSHWNGSVLEGIFCLVPHLIFSYLNSLTCLARRMWNGEWSRRGSDLPTTLMLNPFCSHLYAWQLSPAVAQGEKGAVLVDMALSMAGAELWGNNDIFHSHCGASAGYEQ